MTDPLLTLLLNQGAVALGVALLLAASGVPLPASMMLVAAGAFVRQGVLEAPQALLAAWAGSASGDMVAYGLGRFLLHALPGSVRGSDAWSRAQALFARWGAWSVLVTRCLLTPLALPVSLLAGSTRFAVARYAAAVLMGEALWIGAFGGAGYLFAAQWESVSAQLGNLVGIGLGLALLGWGLWRWRQLRRGQGAG